MEIATRAPADFFQCLICNSFLGSLWKVQKHVEGHEEDEKKKEKVEGDEGGNNNPGNTKTDDTVPVRRRGMLPIRKVTFNGCSVPLVKTQIPLGLELGSRNREQQEESIPSQSPRRRGRPKGSKSKSTVGNTLQKLGTNVAMESFDEDPIANTSGRMPRSCRLKAIQRLKQVSETLRLSEEQDEESKEPSSSRRPTGFRKYYHDDEFQLSNDKPKKKRGRPGKTFSDSDNIIKKPVKCEYCSVIYYNQKSLADHIVEQHKEEAKVIMCPISTCKTPTLNFHWLTEHLRFHVNAERKELLHCSNRNQDDKLPPLEKYCLLHYYRSKSFHCKLCLAKECSMEDLKNHQTNTHPQCNLKCSNCDKGSGFKSSVIAFVNHVRTFHPTELNPHNEHRKKQQQPSPTKSKMLQCDHCHYSCSNQKRLNEHIAAKHTEKPSRYRNMDDEEYARRPFPCPVCKMRFTQQYHLRRHFHLHLENNPYVCEFPNCNRKFNSAHNLKRHGILHDTTRVISRVQCPICKLYFLRKDRLIKHLRTVHKPNDLDTFPGSTFRIARLGMTTFPTSEEPGPNDDIVITADESMPILQPQIKPEPKAHSNSRTSLPKLKVKTEIAGEIHLTDRIVLDEDGTAVHIKGEHLSPENPSEGDSQTPIRPANATIDCQEKASDKTWIAKAKDRAHTTSGNIIKDPVFQRILEKDQSSVLEFVRPRLYSYHSGNTFTCSVCQEVFSRAWTLQLHMKAKHKKTIVEDLIAGKRGESGSNPNQQIITMCGICAYPAKNKGDLSNHMKRAHPADNKRRSWKCGKKGCGSTFETQITLLHHTKQAHSGSGSRNFPCQFCKKAFLNKVGVKHHEKKVHEGRANGEKLKRKCPKCQVTLAPSTFPNHMKKHRDEEKGVEKPKCMLCQDTFSCRMALQRHIDGIHLGKPLNKINYAELRKKKDGGMGRRKKVAEWFDPLLKKLSKPNDDVSKGTEESQPASSAKNPDEREGDGGLETDDAILGF